MKPQAAAAKQESIPSEASCRAQLDRIVQSQDFDATDRERRFLRFIVNETLAGNADRIKAYLIAVAVFERKESFDPQTDPIVRIEAGRLRRALDRYYLTAGRRDPLVITIPKGRYVPVFTWRDPVSELDHGQFNVPAEPLAARPSARPRRTVALFVVTLVSLLAFGLAWATVVGDQAQRSSIPKMPRILVSEFEDLSRSDTSADIASGLTQEIIVQLSRFRDVTVIEPAAPGDDDPEKLPQYVLDGSLSPTLNGFRLRVRLVRRNDGSVLWSDTYDGDLKAVPLERAQAEIADSVASELAKTSGIVFAADAEARNALPPDDLAAYTCVRQFQSFRTTLDAKMLPSVHQCLNRTVARFPDYATGWALLALTEFDILRSGFPYDPAIAQPRLERALASARRAISIDPHNVRGLQAEMLLLFWDRQVEEARMLGDRALAMNPNDAELAMEYGFRLAMSGEWEKGCALIEKARTADLVTIAYRVYPSALCSYFEGNMAKAIGQIRSPTAATHPLSMLVALIIYSEAGNVAEAAHIRSLLEEAAPALLTNVREELDVRFHRSEDVERIMLSLAKSG